MMYNNALMRFWPMNNGGPNMGLGAPNMGTNVPNMGMLPMPFEGGMPRTPYKQQPFNPMPFGGGMRWQQGMPPWGQNSLMGAQNALLGIGGGSRGLGMDIRQRY